MRPRRRAPRFQQEALSSEPFHFTTALGVHTGGGGGGAEEPRERKGQRWRDKERGKRKQEAPGGSGYRCQVSMAVCPSHLVSLSSCSAAKFPQPAVNPTFSLPLTHTLEGQPNPEILKLPSHREIPESERLQWLNLEGNTDP